MYGSSSLYVSSDATPPPEPNREADVYRELQENIADLLTSLKLHLKGAKIILENAGKAIEISIQRADLFDSKEFHWYTVKPGDKLDAICQRLGLNAADVANFSAGTKLKVREERLEFLSKSFV